MKFNYLCLILFPLGLSACQSVPPDCGQLPDDALVGNAGCMILDNGRLLMVQQRVSGRWSMPGGTGETGERAACTALRETQEETGLQVTLKHRVATLPNGFHLYRCDADGDAGGGALDQFEISGWRFYSEQERAGIVWRFEAQHGLIDQLVREQIARDD